MTPPTPAPAAARADVGRLMADKRSTAEREWEREGWMLLLPVLERDPAERVLLTLYEPLTLNLPGGRYTPDYLHILSSGEQIFVEIKGSKKQKGYRDARSKLRAAAEVFPFWTFVEAMGGRDGWEIEEVVK